MLFHSKLQIVGEFPSYDYDILVEAKTAEEAKEMLEEMQQAVRAKAHEMTFTPPKPND